MSLLAKVLDTIQNNVELPPNKVKIKVSKSKDKLDISVERKEPKLKSATDLPLWIEKSIENYLYYGYKSPGVKCPARIDEEEIVKRLLSHVAQEILEFIVKINKKSAKRTSIWKHFDSYTNKELMINDLKYQEILLQVGNLLETRNTKSDNKVIYDTLEAIEKKYKRS